MNVVNIEECPDTGYGGHFQITISRRARGIYLVHYADSDTGFEEWEAFSTLKAAKAWAQADVEKKLRWEETQPYFWFAEGDPY